MRRFIKHLLASACYYSGLMALLSLARRLSGQTEPYMILMYHRVVEDIRSRTEYTQAGINISLAAFEKQMAFLAKEYSVVPLGQLVAHLQQGTPLPRRALVITFDDGWRDNFTLAYPILKKYDLPATIFVSTDFIESAEKFWFLRVGFYLEEGKLTTAQLADVLQELYGDNGGEQHGKTVTRDYLEWVASDHDRFMEALKELDQKNLRRALGELMCRSRLTDDKWPDRRWTLSWDDIRAMDPSLIEIGSHARSHQILTQMSSAEIRRELVESKLLIEEKTGRPVTSIAYPNGDHNEEVRRLARETGYHCGIATHNPEGTALMRDIYALQRVGVHEGVSSTATGRFSPALFACYLRRLF
ncbi:MAG: polysaccharide deacetylase family protein [Candidatus Zixiibacteriota bacterium]